MLWTNEFNLYKTGDQGRSCAKVLLFNNVETNPVGLQQIIMLIKPWQKGIMYGQGDIAESANATQKWIAMSLCFDL